MAGASSMGVGLTLAGGGGGGDRQGRSSSWVPRLCRALCSRSDEETGSGLRFPLRIVRPPSFAGDPHVLAGGWAWLLATGRHRAAAKSSHVGLRRPGSAHRRQAERLYGRLSVPLCLVLLPYLHCSTWAAWHLRRLVSREPCCHECYARPVAGATAAGARPARRRPPRRRFDGRVLAAGGVSFWAPTSLCQTLDADSPGCGPRLRSFVAQVMAHDGPVYVHALGHGRSGACWSPRCCWRAASPPTSRGIHHWRCGCCGRVGREYILTGRQRRTLRLLSRERRPSNCRAARVARRRRRREGQSDRLPSLTLICISTSRRARRRR